MCSRFANCLIAGALASAFALTSPAHAFKGGMSGGMHGMGGGMAMHSMGVGPRVGAPSFAAVPMSRSAWGHSAWGPGFSRSAFPHHAHFFHHHRFHRHFAFVGVPFFYAGYDDCWRRVWTRYGLQWVNACAYYGY